MRVFGKNLWSLQVLRTMSLRLEDVPPDCFLAARNYRHRFIRASELFEHAADPRNDLTEEFLRYAGSKGDWCSAVFEGETLVSYSWYSTKPTRFIRGLQFEFPSDDVYMYRGYTIASHRGRRLHAVGIAHACRTFTEMGYRRLVSYVDVRNEKSLRSVARLGYSHQQRVFVLRILGRNFVSYENTGARVLFVRHVPRHDDGRLVLGLAPWRTWKPSSLAERSLPGRSPIRSTTARRASGQVPSAKPGGAARFPNASSVWQLWAE